LEAKYCVASETFLRRCVFIQLTAEQKPGAFPPLPGNEEFSCIQRLFRAFLALSRLLLNKQYVGLNSGMKRGVQCFREKGLTSQNWEFHCASWARCEEHILCNTLFSDEAYFHF